MPEDAMPTPSPVPPAAGQTAMGTPQAVESEKGLAAVAYIFWWVTGLIILLVAKKEQRYVRWNAVQALGMGITLSLFFFLFNSLFWFGVFGGFGAIAFLGMLSALLWLAAVALTIIVAVKAYQGTPVRLPILAELADKNA